MLNFLSTLTMIAITGLIINVLLIYFGYNINYFHIVVIDTLGMFSTLIPISISGLGIRKSIVVYLYSLEGVDPAVSISIYLLLAFFLYTASAFVLLVTSRRLKGDPNENPD